MKYVIYVGIAPYVAAWMSPRGTSGMWSCNRWTRDVEQAHAYESERKAGQALARLKRNNTTEFTNAAVASEQKFSEMLQVVVV